MTYRELVAQLASMTDEQLDMPVTMYDTDDVRVYDSFDSELSLGEYFEASEDGPDQDDETFIDIEPNRPVLVC